LQCLPPADPKVFRVDTKKMLKSQNIIHTYLASKTTFTSLVFYRSADEIDEGDVNECLVNPPPTPFNAS
jgi:hypothetical protein